MICIIIIVILKIANFNDVNFKNIIGRWNTAAADSLPSYMRSCYKALYTITNEIADMAEKEHGLNPANNLRKAVCFLIILSCMHFFNLST